MIPLKSQLSQVSNTVLLNLRIIQSCTNSYVLLSRWRGAVLPILTGYYWFSVVANDMARLWVDGDLLLDHVTAQRTYRELPRRLYLLAGQLYEVEIQYIQVEGEAFCHFTWAASSGEWEGCYKSHALCSFSALHPFILLTVSPVSFSRPFTPSSTHSYTSPITPSISLTVPLIFSHQVLSAAPLFPY